LSSDDVRAEAFWWGFEITLSANAVNSLNLASGLIAAAIGGFLTAGVAALCAAAVAARALAYHLIAGSGGLVLASPWPFPLMLAPIRGANLGDDKMAWATFSDGRWSSAAKFPGKNYTSARPAFATYRDSLYLLHRGAGDTQIWYMKYDPTLGWGESTSVSNSESACDVAGCEFLGRLHVVHRGAGNDALLWHITYDGSNWSNDVRMASMYTSDGPALAVYDGKLFCAARGTDGRLWYTYTTDGQNWSSYVPIYNGSAYTSSGPALCTYNGALVLVARGTEQDGRLWYATYTNGWSNYQQISVYYLTSAAPSLCVFRNLLFCCTRGNEGELWWTSWDGTSWSNYYSAGLQVSEYGPAITSYYNKNSEQASIFCAFKGDTPS
jgi:hypothetical protein